MLFKRQDQAQKFIDLVRNEQKQLANLESTFQNEITLTWNDDQAACDRAAAMLAAFDNTYVVSVNQKLFDARREALKQNFASALAERDAGTVEISKELASLKHRIRRRLGCVIEQFGIWSSGISNLEKVVHYQGTPIEYQLGDLREQLLAAREQAAEISDPAALLDLIKKWTEKIEDLDGLTIVPLLRLDHAIQRALEVQ